MKKLLLAVFFVPAVLFGQSSLIVEKPDVKYPFGQIFTGFRYGFNKDFEPRAAFEFNQGIIGYYHEISGKVSGKIMFDVTRTTNIYEITDSLGNQMDINYFEGSKYTAFLKMAEIRWNISERFTFRVGQLLNTQYLTFNDRFWGYRYIDVTFQEKYRLGNPADFGAQLDIKTGRFLHQFSVVNGEGPFRYQDDNSKFIYSYNVQYSVSDQITLKLYADIAPDAVNSETSENKYVGSFFAGYRTDKFRAAAEFDYVMNYGFEEGRDHYGLSAFASWSFHEKFDLLARYDRLIIEMPGNTEYENYIIGGVQYVPVEYFTTSLNFRYITSDELPLVYASFGLKF